jgi:hypothetical protein
MEASASAMSLGSVPRRRGPSTFVPGTTTVSAVASSDASPCGVMA